MLDDAAESQRESDCVSSTCASNAAPGIACSQASTYQLATVVGHELAALTSPEGLPVA